MNETIDTDRPIQYTLSAVDTPIPYRVRVATPSAELRSFVVPQLSIQGRETPELPAERPSEVRMRATRAA